MCLGDPSIKIAVLDGSVDLKHPCFNTVNNKLVPAGSQEVLPSSSDNLSLRHGTAVASLIFGKPNSKHDGVAPGCSSIFIPIYSQNANGQFTSATQVSLARAITIAIEKGANIINISGGQLSKSGDAESFLKKAIDDCYKAGVLIVAATGNDGCRCLHVPAADKQVLAVGSIDVNGKPTSMTNYGDKYLVNGILAPGQGLSAAAPQGGTFITGEGTSFATPIVSGVAALLMSLQKRRGIKPDAYVIKSILEQTSTPCTKTAENNCSRFLRGTLNIDAAIDAILENPKILASGNFYTKNEKVKTMDDTTTINESKTVSTNLSTETLMKKWKKWKTK